MAHGRDHVDPTLTQIVGRAWRATLVLLIGWVAWYALEAGMQGNLPLSIAMVGVLLAVALVLLASALVAAIGSSQ